jgi:hypothetical protein
MLHGLGEREEQLRVEALGFVLLARKGLDDANLGDRLLQHSDRLALRLLRHAREIADLPTEALTEQADGRRDHEREQREFPVHQEDDDQTADKRQDLPQHLQDRLRDDAMDDGRVARDVRHEIAGLAHVEEGQRQRLEVADDRHAQIEDDPLAGVGHDVLAHAVDDGAYQQHDDESGDEEVEEARILEPVHDPLDDLGPIQTQDRRDDQQDRGEDQVPLVWSHEVQQAPVHRKGRPLPGLIAARAHEHHVPTAATRPHDHHASIMRSSNRREISDALHRGQRDDSTGVATCPRAGPNVSPPVQSLASERARISGRRDIRAPSSTSPPPALSCPSAVL